MSNKLPKYKTDRIIGQLLINRSGINEVITFLQIAEEGYVRDVTSALDFIVNNGQNHIDLLGINANRNSEISDHDKDIIYSYAVCKGVYDVLDQFTPSSFENPQTMQIIHHLSEMLTDLNVRINNTMLSLKGLSIIHVKDDKKVYYTHVDDILFWSDLRDDLVSATYVAGSFNPSYKEKGDLFKHLNKVSMKLKPMVNHLLKSPSKWSTDDKSKSDKDLLKTYVLLQGTLYLLDYIPFEHGYGKYFKPLFVELVNEVFNIFTNHCNKQGSSF